MGEAERSRRRVLKWGVLFGSLVIIIAAVFGLQWYQANLSGADTAFLPAPEPIGPLLNTTAMPLALPDGFRIDAYATDLQNPRVILVDERGTVLVSDMGGGKVVALPDRNADGRADEQIVLAEKLTRPHGLALRCAPNCQLYVAEADALSRWDYDAEELRLTGQHHLLDLPEDGNHFTKSLLFLPPPQDDQLLISIGSTCNVCREQDDRRAKVMVVNADGSQLRAYASGLRNAVFLTLHHTTDQVWVTEMGRDLLGDDLPPDEINILEPGSNYGWPDCYGAQVRDLDFSSTGPDPCPETVPATLEIQAHSAPLGLAFVPLDSPWPEQYRGDLLVALHGSWNRTVPTGYSIARFDFDENGHFIGSGEFLTGWLTADDRSLGRPAGLGFDQSGALFVADDKAGLIYRVVPTEPDL